MPSYRLALEDQAIAVVYEAIEDRVCHCPIAEVGVPLVDGELTGDNRGNNTEAFKDGAVTGEAPCCRSAPLA
jgi:hypothetical protein